MTGGVDAQGRFVVSTYPERAKTANARRDPRVSVLVLSDDFGGAWVQVDGDCEVIDPPDSVEPLVEYFRCISGEHPDWDEYRRAMVEQGKSLLRVTPTRWGPIATGGFPARLADPRRVTRARRALGSPTCCAWASPGGSAPASRPCRPSWPRWVPSSSTPTPWPARSSSPAPRRWPPSPTGSVPHVLDRDGGLDRPGPRAGSSSATRRRCATSRP